MGDISRPDVLQNCGIINYIQHLSCTRVICQYFWIVDNSKTNIYFQTTF